MKNVNPATLEFAIIVLIKAVFIGYEIETFLNTLLVGRLRSSSLRWLEYHSMNKVLG